MSSNNSIASPGRSDLPNDVSSALTPSRKVQALLAQFSDSDSEHENEGISQQLPPKSSPTTQSIASEEESGEQENEVQRGGRLVARLLGEQTNTRLESDNFQHIRHRDDREGSTSPDRVGDEDTNGRTTIDSSDDDISRPVQRRRQLLYNKDQSVLRGSPSPDRTIRSPSPLFFPSPSKHAGTTSHPATSPSSESDPAARSESRGNSKFLALVEKHRKERIAKDAAEVAKRAARATELTDATPRRVRGSSPADDSSEGDESHENSDALKRIQKQARPTRKASKKALEEMNRETQRMSRNMQLAHQTMTKKRITKESLLARFNFASDNTNKEVSTKPVKNSNAPSSTSASDAETENSHHTTPPTSPMQETETSIQKDTSVAVNDVSHLLSTGEFIAEMHGALGPEKDLPILERLTHEHNVAESTYESFNFPQTHIVTAGLQPSEKLSAICSSHIEGKPTTGTRTNKVRTARQIIEQHKDSDSDGEVDIVTDRGLKRKYAAFESLPKRKAKEMPSHLALRSLAHLLVSDKNRSINAAELETNLRRKARMQAVEERRQKIEDLKAKGIVIQTTEERERDQQEVEDLVEQARQEAVEIQKREKALAKKDGTYQKDNLDDSDDDDSNDDDFEAELEGSLTSGSEEEDDGDHEDPPENSDKKGYGLGLFAEEAEEAKSDEEADASQEERETDEPPSETDIERTSHPRPIRNTRVIQDDEDEEDEDEERDSAFLHSLPLIKTPRSARKFIPGLQMSDDLPMGLSQAFAATMAESQNEGFTESQEQDSLDLTADLPSLRVASVPPLQRLDSIDCVSDSQPSASQSQLVSVNLLSQSQVIPESPRNPSISEPQFTPSQHQIPFELTQDNGYILSPFAGNRFSETPNLNFPHSTVETVILPHDNEGSPVMQRRGRLLRGRAQTIDDGDGGEGQAITAFQVMETAAKARLAEQSFDKKKSTARNIVDEAAEESEDEYAGLGGASDDSGDDEENEDDRRMIDEDTQVGKGDEAKLAGLYADRERERDEVEVSKLLKDITTGALRRKRGVGDDLDLSDEEDAAARRRESKRREFARMRRELLKDEAVGKIAEDKKKEAFLRSIEDREADEDDGHDFDPAEATGQAESQSQSQNLDGFVASSQDDIQAGQKRKRPLDVASESEINRIPQSTRRTNTSHTRKPATLAEIRESVSFLIEEPESQAAMVDLGLSESEDEPEAYVNLDRHFRDAEADENKLGEDDEDLGGFIVDDEPPSKSDSHDQLFKKPELRSHERAPYTERRTKHTDVVDRLSLIRHASSSASSTMSTASGTTRMAFATSKTGLAVSGVPTLLRRATTNSSFGSRSGRENVSATGVVTHKTERGKVEDEKEFVRKGSGGRRNAVNYQAERKTLREEKMSARAGISKASKSKKGQGFLGGLFRGNSWE